MARKGKMLNENNKYFKAQYVRQLQANANTQDQTVPCIAIVLKQCIMKL